MILLFVHNENIIHINPEYSSTRIARGTWQIWLRTQNCKTVYSAESTGWIQIKTSGWTVSIALAASLKHLLFPFIFAVVLICFVFADSVVLSGSVGTDTTLKLHAKTKTEKGWRKKKNKKRLSSKDFHDANYGVQGSMKRPLRREPGHQWQLMQVVSQTRRLMSFNIHAGEGELSCWSP